MLNINKLSEKLLDISFKNRMVNFVDSKTQSLEIKWPNINSLFDAVSTGKKLEFFDVDKAKLKLGDPKVKNLENFSITYDSFYKANESKLKQTNIVGYRNKGSIVDSLSNIIKKNNASLEEKGINTLYLSFGILEYTDNSDKYSAPLLLIPIKIENTSKLSPFYLELLEDEIMLNPTLKQKFEVDYKLNIPEYDNEPIDDYFVKLDELFKKQKFKIIKESYVGVFSFMKVNMYKDLKTNTDLITKNKIVNSIFGKDIEIDKSSSDKNSSKLYTILSSDKSQIDAINAVRRGESIVIEGPPGTGKSQTICNLIAALIAENKKVLFVSEKNAALEVVYNKLKHAGLEDYLLALHSHKAQKKEVIENLYNTLNKIDYTISDSSLENLNVLEKVGIKLDSYDKTLHQVDSKYGVTPYEVFMKNASLSSVNTFDLKININNVVTYHKDAMELIDVYQKYNSMIGYNYKEFIFYGFNKFQPSEFAKLEKSIKTIIVKLNGVLHIFGDIKKEANLDLVSLNDIKESVQLYKIISEAKNIHSDFFKIKKVPKLLKASELLIEYSTQLIEYKTYIDTLVNQDFYNLDVIELNNRFQNDYIGLGKSFKSGYKNDVKLIRTYEISDGKISHNDICKLLDYKIKYDCIIQLFLDQVSTFKQYFSNMDLNFDFANLYNTLKGLNELSLDLTTFKYDSSIDYTKQYNKYKKDTKDCFTLNKNHSIYNEKIIDFNNHDAKFLYTNLIKCSTNFMLYDTYCSFMDVIKSIKKLDLEDLLDECFSKKMSFEDIKNIIDKLYYKELLNHIVQNNPILAKFNIVDHELDVEKFKELDKKSYDISKEIIVSTLSKNRPNKDVIISGSGAHIINREFNKKRRQLSVRSLLNEISDTIIGLKPCFMMSPLSVSTYLDPSKYIFDVVIFDEASQIFPYDAIGSIYRGKSLVVVGDGKQMPPSNFFGSINYDETTDDDISDFESILDICQATFKTYSLRWHYRSLNEQLIAFSNSKFYDKKLISFPQAKSSTDDFGVQNIYVPNGVYDRKSKYNLNEALKVVELVEEHFKKFSNSKSLGVVAFSKSQQQLIEKEIEKKGFDIPLNEFEPFFVKNLETVQGDERDVIIFSIGYGYDESKKFIQNFGPLNVSGGERRLNVAVTRAKENVKLVTSIRSKDINSDNLGANFLKEYIQLSEDGYAKFNSNSMSEDQFNNYVAKYLKDEGYRVDTNVGFSDMKIDICIKSNNSDDYSVAILTDGTQSHNCLNTRDREKSRDDILRRMGFKVIRIYSTLWFKNEEVAKVKLVNDINEDLVHKLVDLSETFTSTNSTDEESEYFELSDDEALISKFKKIHTDFEPLINTVLNKEGAIQETWFLKRFLKIFNKSKVTQTVIDDFILAKAMFLDVNKFESKDGFLRFKNKNIKFKKPKDYVREINQITLDEIADAVITCLCNNTNLKKDELLKELSNYMGYKKISDSFTTRFNLVLNYMLEKKVINLMNDDITLV
ncbi:MAG: DUF4011 domain-containing protein [Anaeroplasmataceae bacterium]